MNNSDSKIITISYVRNFFEILIIRTIQNNLNMIILYIFHIDLVYSIGVKLSPESELSKEPTQK